jgi:RluA family pseudouridine synthase
MPPRKYTLRTSEQHRGQRLDQILASWLPEALAQPVSKAKARKLIVAGAVYLNGKRVRIASKELLPNARVEVHVDLARLNSGGDAKDQPFQMSKERILYEDDYLIAVDKPAGLPTQPTLDEARDNLFASVRKFLSARDSAPQAYVGLHHRLDRDTSGVVLFTKNPAANPGVSRLFAEHLAVKTYQALAQKPARPLSQSWTVKNYLGVTSRQGKRKKFGSVRSGGDFAHTDFKVLEDIKSSLWIEAKPRTGRTHQIRVHLAESGMAILGDLTYGSPASVAPRLMLHAVNLTFPHPISNLEVSIGSPLPEDFAQCLQQLRNGIRPGQPRG